jgi:hypothetical protein
MDKNNAVGGLTDSAILKISEDEAINCVTDERRPDNATIITFARAIEREALATRAPADLRSQDTINAAFEDHHCGYVFPSDALRGGALNQFSWGWHAALKMVLSTTKQVSEPVEYQGRMRPMWKPEGEGWTEWAKCSEGTYDDYKRVPVNNDWQFESRALYTTPPHPAEAPAPAALIRAYNSGYKAGHHDTVEAQYADISQRDMDTYHADVVADLIADGTLAASPVPANDVQGERKSTDLSKQLREYAKNPGYSHNDYADTMRQAADEIERYYGGMLAWKRTAEAKDREFAASLSTPSPVSASERVPEEMVEAVVMAARSILYSHKLSEFVDSDGEQLPLVDHLSNPAAVTIHSGQAEIELIADAIGDEFQQIAKAFVQPAAPADDSHGFKNFHRMLCDRFGYVHDERDWRRDQVSLMEHIAKLAAPASQVRDDELVRDRVLEEVAQEIDSYADSSLEGAQLEAAITFVKLIRALRTPASNGNGNGEKGGA